MPIDLNEIITPINQSFSSVSNTIVEHVPAIIIAIILVFIGWVIASIVGRFVGQIINSLGFIDESIKAVGLDRVFSQAGISLNVGNFLGAVVKVFIIVVSIVAAFDVLGLEIINQYLTTTITFLHSKGICSRNYFDCYFNNLKICERFDLRIC